MRVVLFTRLGFAGFIGCVVISFLCAITADGQATRSISTVGRRLDEFNKQSEKVALDEMNREMHGRKPTAEERRVAAAKKVQIKEDFETLQASYNEILTKLQSKEPLTTEYLSDVVGKINKGASRLRQNIEFPVKSSEQSKTDLATSATNGLPKLLCVQVYAFLTSPIFETGILDIVEAEKARDTLDKIIHTSASIRQQLGKID